ncbi:hypothetical protein IFM89_015452 [Coptis chinensis]|uniref:3'-5' exonuclease domain-containing protein n=1 Tax=Coptis chinensis TaxID=261450 RepID=A0A835ICP5_9MAGN|nr:hypothetical protein IFM89_015452 [Coptis chinensis]
MSNLTIQDLDISSETHSTYRVQIDTNIIHTTVTSTPSVVDQYINDLLYTHRSRLNRLVVGLDTEWRPQNPVATLQLCVGHKCLIFQFLYMPHVPLSLINFLNNPMYTFVGVEIEKDVEKLLLYYKLGVANAVDLRSLAVGKGFVGKGLKSLAREVVGLVIEKSEISWSTWDDEWLSDDQISYACVDAFVSFEIGKRLIWGDVKKGWRIGGFRIFKLVMLLLMLLFLYLILGIDLEDGMDD